MPIPFHLHHQLGEWAIRLTSPIADSVIAWNATSKILRFTNTLTGLTLTAPTISDFTNANHDHGDNDDGGPLVVAALPEHGAGQHDTTVSDNPHGIADHTDRSGAEFWPADAFALDGATRVSGGTTPNIYSAIQFDDAVTEGAYILVRVPDWVVASSTPTFTMRFAPQDGTGGNVRWQVTVLAASTGTDLTGAGTTAAATSSASTTAHGLRFGTASPGVTISGGNFIRIQVERLGGDALDTYAAAINFLGININYTADH